MIQKIVLLCLFILGVLTGIYGIPKGYPVIASLFPIVFALPLVFILFRSYSFIKIILLLTLLSLFALAIETVGVLTGFPYGHFFYTDLFAFKLFETTPIIVPFGWIPIVIGAYMVVKKFSLGYVKNLVLFIALLLLADAIIDPGAVRLGMWVYQDGGVYYGVPVSNFLGWILSGTVAFMLLNHFLRTSNSQIIFYFACLLVYWTGIALGSLLIIPSCIGVGLLILLSKWITSD
jgi:putative membrane protein